MVVRGKTKACNIIVTIVRSNNNVKNLLRMRVLPLQYNISTNASDLKTSKKKSKEERAGERCWEADVSILLKLFDNHNTQDHIVSVISPPDIVSLCLSL